MGQKLSLMTKKVGRGSRDCPDSCEVGGGVSYHTHTHTHTHTNQDLDLLPHFQQVLH